MSSRPRLPRGDAAAREAIANDLDDTLIVEAAAGTGKTTELVNRILRVLATGARDDGRDRRRHVHREGGRRAEAAPAREARAGSRRGQRPRPCAPVSNSRSRQLEEAHVNTIHGFCAELLRERPVEARVDPLFAVLTEPQADRLYGARVPRLAAGGAEEPAGGRCAARCGEPARRRSAATAAAGRSIACATPGDRSPSARDFPCPWERPPFDRAARDRSRSSRRCIGSPR